MENRNSTVSSTPSTVVQPNRQRNELDKSGMDPWAPLVLSVDGGGVRGLSTLYILRRIMLRIRELEADESRVTVSDDDLRLPLPCHYFDSIVGVSTGGLIAIMLGRLRMDVNECIQQYYIICNRIFRPHKHIGNYSATRFEGAINDVIRKFCKCHPGECSNPHTHYLRQYDYLEYDEGTPVGSPIARKMNSTCKVGVLTQRRAHGPNQPDHVYLMRSYNHPSRPRTRAHSVLNRDEVDSSTLIWQACRATAAAPRVFDKILIDGRWHIDGSVGDNNPSNYAWNEANSICRTNNQGNNVAMLVSIGTGMTEPHTKFGGLLALLKYARKAITETEKAHSTTRDIAHLVNADYFRFDVRPIRNVHDGLSKTKIDECKKKKKKQQQPQRVPSLTLSDSHGDESTPETREQAKKRIRILRDMDTHNNTEAAQPGVKDGYKPGKYDYTTFHTIRRRTNDYCLSSRYSFPRQSTQEEAQNVREEVNRCATILFQISQRRKQNDLERWQRFRRHPDPQNGANRANTPREG